MCKNCGKNKTCKRCTKVNNEQRINLKKQVSCQKGCKIHGCGSRCNCQSVCPTPQITYYHKVIAPCNVIKPAPKILVCLKKPRIYKKVSDCVCKVC